MTGDKSRSAFNGQIYEEACEWFVSCRGGDLDGSARREFDLWLRKSPEHLSAYLEIAAIWNEGPSFDPQHKWDAATLIAQALKPEENIVRLSDASEEAPASHASLRPMNADMRVARSGSAPPARSKFRLAGRRFPPLAASAVGLCLIGAPLVWLWLWRFPTYATTIGEQRFIALADGSTVELNSRSRIRIRYSPQERAVDLVDGQALFHVAKDHKRPFVVSSDAAEVRAVGTQFDVYKKRGGTIVSVVEGRVAVLTRPEDVAEADDANRTTPPDVDSAGSQATYLGAGEQLAVTAAAVRKIARPNVATATAWTQHQIVFDAASLAEVAEEFNRYNVRQIVIQDPDLDDFHISGVFSSADPGPLIQFLRERSGAHVTETPSEIRVAKNNS